MSSVLLKEAELQGEGKADSDEEKGCEEESIDYELDEEKDDNKDNSKGEAKML